jgi:hypothetical protein
MAQEVPKDNGPKATEITYIHWDGEFGSTNFTGFNTVSCDFDYFGGILGYSGYIDEVDPGLYATGKKVDWDPLIGAELIGVDYAPDIDQRYGNRLFLPTDFFGPGSDPFDGLIPDDLCERPGFGPYDIPLPAGFFGPGSEPFDCPIPEGFFGPGSDPFDPPPAVGPFPSESKPDIPPLPTDKPPEITYYPSDDDWDKDYDPYMPAPPRPSVEDHFPDLEEKREQPGRLGGMIVDDPSLHIQGPYRIGGVEWDPSNYIEHSAKKKGKCPYKEEGKWKWATKPPKYQTQERNPIPKGGSGTAKCPKCGKRTTKREFRVTYQKQRRQERKIAYCTLEAGHKHHHELKSKMESRWIDVGKPRTVTEYRYGCGHKRIKQ